MIILLIKLIPLSSSYTKKLLDNLKLFLSKQLIIITSNHIERKSINYELNNPLIQGYKEYYLFNCLQYSMISYLCVTHFIKSIFFIIYNYYTPHRLHILFIKLDRNNLLFVHNITTKFKKVNIIKRNTIYIVTRIF